MPRASWSGSTPESARERSLAVGETIAAMADADLPCGETPRQAVARLGRDMAEFVRAKGLAHLVVVNVASTEPAAEAAALPLQWAELEERLAAGEKGGQSRFRGGQVPSPGEVSCAAKTGTLPDREWCPLPASSLYAIAALGAGHSYINFTPSLGASPAAIDELARQHGACHYGCDGKTGETLMKSVLAPMFAQRNLRVQSWVGHNIFGNRDGTGS